MAKKNNANIGFEKQIWDAACVLWGHIPAAEYRKVIVGLIFLRYISSAFEKRYEELVEESYGFENDRDAYAEENIFFVPEEARWSKISSAAHTPEISGRIVGRAGDELVDGIFKYLDPLISEKLKEISSVYKNFFVEPQE